MRSASLLTGVDGPFKEIIDKRTEGLLEHIAENAEKGMRINAKKTSLMCISAATTFKSNVRVTVLEPIQ